VSAKSLGFLTFLFLAVYLFLRYAMPYVMPFVIGICLAFLLEPLVALVSRKLRLNRGFSAFLVILLIVGITSLLLSWGITRVAVELTDLYRDFPQYYQELQRVMTEALRIIGEVSQRLPEPLAKIVQDQWNHLYSMLSVVVTGAGGVVRSLPGLSVTLIFTLLSTYFVIRDRVSIGGFLRDIIPPKVFESLKHVELDMLTGVAGFVRAQIVLVLFTMVINIIGLTLLGSRYTVALGVLLAILDVLPVIGPGLVYLPWIGYHLFWGSMTMAVGLIVLYAGVSFIRQVIQTHLVGREMGLHPLVTLISLYVGFRLFGVWGLIYGPLIAILVKGLWASGIIPHEGGGAN